MSRETGPSPNGSKPPHFVTPGVDSDQVLAYLLHRAEWSASRSSGPGGQHRDKASTRAELTVRSESLAGLEPQLTARLEAGLRLDEHPLRIVVQDERSLARNQEIAIQRLSALVSQAMAPLPPARRPTRPSRSRRRARLDDKARRGDVKRLRQPPTETV